MNKKLLNILACPIDKYFPLECFELEMKKTDVVEKGVLYCKKCTRFYLVIDQIPILLPDEFRSEQDEKKFLLENQKKLPHKITNEARPWHI